jgi:hypothetical protein
MASAFEILEFIIVQVPWFGFVWFGLALFECTRASVNSISGHWAIV